MHDAEILFTVTDLKQFTYCPRVTFYERCLPHLRPTTYKMEAGREAHEDEEKLARRRGFSAFHLVEGERLQDQWLTDTTLGLTGRIDEIVVTPQGERFPVDYKLSKQVNRNHKVQLAAYALLMEAAWGKPVTRGYVGLLLTGQMLEIALSDKLKTEVKHSIERMKKVIVEENMPNPTPVRNSCLDCEFRRFCNDV